MAIVEAYTLQVGGARQIEFIGQDSRRSEPKALHARYAVLVDQNRRRMDVPGRFLYQWQFFDGKADFTGTLTAARLEL
jgi:hypothetical protein